MQIHWVDGDVFGAAAKARVEERLDALSAGHDDLIDVRITTRASGHHKHGDQEVRITCAARGKEIVAARTRPDASLALNEAMDVFERELNKLRERRTDRRRQRDAHAPPAEAGVIDVVVSDRDHGFILTDSGDRVYFHKNALHALDFRKLQEGQRVSLDIEAGDEGLQATVVRPPPLGVA